VSLFYNAPKPMRAEGVIDGESGGSDCDEAIYAQDEVNQEESEQNEVDGRRELIPQVWCY